MKLIQIDNVAQYADITDISVIGNKLTSPEAPVVVIFTENLGELSDRDRLNLKNCPALTVIAGENLSKIPKSVLSEFDLRLTQPPSPVVNLSPENEICAPLCGEKSAYKYKMGDDIGEFFFTILNGEQPIYEETVNYLGYLIKDKNEIQLYSLASCFRAARNGSAQDVFAQESLQFYHLMQNKAKEDSCETNA